MPRKMIDQAKIDEIAERDVYWFGGERKNQDLDSMLVFILAKQPHAEAIVRKELGITDEDFRRALKHAEPGVFIWEGHWEEQNKRLGIDPPLPFPVLDWNKFHEEFLEYEKTLGDHDVQDAAKSA